jgi:hypothetical protein
MYDPSLGRWLTEDPIDFAGGDNNFYGFVGNNPVNKLDPSGLAELPPGLEIRRVPPVNRTRPFTPGGLEITYKIKGAHKIEFIQFKQVSAKVTCTGFRSCKVLYEGDLTGKHMHGDQVTTFSRPGRPIWELDRGLTGATPFYPSLDVSPLDGSSSGSQILDFPIIAEEAVDEFRSTADALERDLKRRFPGEGGVFCSIKATANFRTYIIVDGKAIGYVSWSISTGSGPTVHGFVPGTIPDSLNGVIRDRYPDYQTPR